MKKRSPRRARPGCSVTLVEFNPSGGLFQFAVQLGEALAQRGLHVELVTGPRPELSSRTAGFIICPMLPTWHASSGSSDPTWRRRLRRLERGLRYHLAWGVLSWHLWRNMPDVVQFSESRFPVDGLVPAMMARKKNPRPVLVGLAHSPVPFNEQTPSGAVFKVGPLSRAALEMGYRHLDAVLVLGERTATDLRNAYPRVERIHVIPHGDESVFVSGDVPSAANTEPVLLFFGTLQAYKGLDLLLDAFSIVKAQRPHARLTVAGAASGDVDVGQLRCRAEAIGGVEFRVGYVPMKNVQDLFVGARAVVAPYRYANASGVVELARTFARPVVVTEVGDLAAAIENEVSGFVVPANDARQLAAALVRLVDYPDEAGRMGAAAKAASTTGSSWLEVAQKVEAVYDAHLRERGSTPNQRDPAAT